MSQTQRLQDQPTAIAAAVVAVAVVDILYAFFQLILFLLLAHAQGDWTLYSLMISSTVGPIFAARSSLSGGEKLVHALV